MLIHQFPAADGPVSYAIWSSDSDEVVLIDPAAEAQLYYDFANARGADIVAVIETRARPTARAGHLAIVRATGATLYVPASASDEVAAATSGTPTLLHPGDVLLYGGTRFEALAAPDEPTSTEIGRLSLLVERGGHEYALFSGHYTLLGAADSVLSAILLA